ncbi:hypothetical protein ASPZODRAFT_129376 [Penicilliopsis zonata CBS 506.65]|uniref:Uncharacterized protein n=1 Tax=Penicilliopsis zonata CBS 506.65 TaxID=1073090 RepID=A0A1L9SPG2_9EURO|nr:hypothetical protein ASPZODRAFT_129376 [Penicilliopsis zonata CBS 506.65]OJJ49006.1 hypothetical protein ASPZODRAFT_129376 [Penicilliopsis zonata CBS 506.65]
MPRGAEFDNKIPQSDNAIDAGPTKVHGTNPAHADLSHTQHVADLPEIMGGNGILSGGGSSGHQSGKGGHEPKSLGEQKGLGAHKA